MQCRFMYHGDHNCTRAQEAVPGARAGTPHIDSQAVRHIVKRVHLD